jgi:hypothetical protein
MGMIHLDKFYWELFRLNPSYEQFMYSFTGARRVQVCKLIKFPEICSILEHSELFRFYSKLIKQKETYLTFRYKRRSLRSPRNGHRSLQPGQH